MDSLPIDLPATLQQKAFGEPVALVGIAVGHSPQGLGQARIALGALRLILHPRPRRRTEPGGPPDT